MSERAGAYHPGFVREIVSGDHKAAADARPIYCDWLEDQGDEAQAKFYRALLARRMPDMDDCGLWMVPPCWGYSGWRLSIRRGQNSRHVSVCRDGRSICFYAGLSCYVACPVYDWVRAAKWFCMNLPMSSVTMSRSVPGLTTSGEFYWRQTMRKSRAWRDLPIPIFKRLAADEAAVEYESLPVKAYPTEGHSSGDLKAAALKYGRDLAWLPMPRGGAA